MTTKPTKRQEDKLDGLLDDIKCGLFEDFQWESKEQAQEILNKLKAKVNAITIDQVFDINE